FHFDGQATKMIVAGHCFDPGVGHADDRTGKVVVGEADTLEHSACTCTVTPFGDDAAVLLGVICHAKPPVLSAESRESWEWGCRGLCPLPGRGVAPLLSLFQKVG